MFTLQKIWDPPGWMSAVPAIPAPICLPYRCVVWLSIPFIPISFMWAPKSVFLHPRTPERPGCCRKADRQMFRSMSSFGITETYLQPHMGAAFIKRSNLHISLAGVVAPLTVVLARLGRQTARVLVTGNVHAHGTSTT